MPSPSPIRPGRGGRPADAALGRLGWSPQRAPHEVPAAMLFHIKQTHAPADCPYGKAGSLGLFDRDADGVKLIGYYLAFPEHTLFFIVDTDDIKHLQAFLKPGTGI